LGAGYGGESVGNRVVRWEMLGNRVLLRTVNYSVVSSDPKSEIVRAVEDSNLPAIVRSFNVAAFNADGDPVVDVTQLYTTEISELSARPNLNGRGYDTARSFISKAVSFPQNINIEVVQTYTAPIDTTGRGRGATGMRGNSGTVLTFHSMIKLPETPMMPRLFDERVGYFLQSTTDFGGPKHGSEVRRYITRYRLEKKDPSAAVSEPVKPIVYYVDPATPKKWVEAVKRGIEEWQPAFEAAGFKNAIIAKEAPSPEEDPDWSAEDVRYSVIRWLPSTIENANGPHIHDPRSGEILEADVNFYHNVQNLVKDWYWVQVGPLDPRAKTLPLPDDLMSRLIEYVVAHEVGHTLGFQHNMKASSTYTMENVRDKAFVKANGHTPTLMDYSRFNYVAQPEDGIDPADLVPKIGQYDKWAAMWGYAPIAGAKTPEDERPTLDAWAREQDTKPYLRFSTDGGAGDPGNNTEAVGDIDAEKATGLGLKNLVRATDMLLTATTTKTGDPYDELTEVYGRIVAQWTLEMNHVTQIVGGVLSQQKHIGQEGVRFTTVPKTRQADAVQFLLTNAFQTPAFLVREDLLRRMEPTGVVNRIRTAQNSVMNSLLQNARLDRLVEQAALEQTAYTPIEFLAAVRRGIWSELATPGRPIDTFRRNTQRVYLDTIDNRLNGTVEPSDEVRSLLKGELRAARATIVAAIPAATDQATRRHLEDARDQIDNTLDPKAQRARPGTGAAAAGRGVAPGTGAIASGTNVTAPGSRAVLSSSARFDYDNDPFLRTPEDCWFDPVIR
ncbi:MAG TPA: zinc-dependent metalloprotease, partial [Vicinamibacterales bacterium]|nr:zinc-dependent metalloprotease [Vicinamibacterales bacterium]